MVHLIQILGFFLVAADTSHAAFQGWELKAKQSVELNLYHVVGEGSSLIPETASYFSNLLAFDEERVKGLQSRIEGKGARAGGINVSSSLNQGLSVRVPLNPGLSIGTGNYYVKLGLGTPPKLYTMILDTGSSFSWLQCQPCRIYCHNQADPLFDPSQSKTFKSLPCTGNECSLVKGATLNAPFCSAATNTCIYTASYGDASFSIGYLSQDVLTLMPSLILSRFVFGCGQDNQGLFGRASGIIGLARNRLSMLAQLGGGAFSYCLPTASYDSKGGGRGFFSIGTSSTITSTEFKFTPLLISPQNPTLYFVRLAAIRVEGVALSVDAGQFKVPILIDSGTVITRLPSPVYVALRQAFVKIVSTKHAQAPAFSILDACFKGSLKSNLGVPRIQLVFQGGADLTLAAPNVVIEAIPGVICLAFASTNQIGIIGNHQQQTFKVAYDVSNSRIGFAAGGCL